MIWQPGQQLQNGKYTISRVLSENSLSVTYQVETSKGELYAIKAPNDEAIPPADFVRVQEMFRREALKLAKCKHPNIITINRRQTFLILLGTSIAGLALGWAIALAIRSNGFSGWAVVG